MKLSHNGFKGITEKKNIEESGLKGYLSDLYGDPNYEEKDKAYLEDTDPDAVHGYKERGNRLFDNLADISGLSEFRKLKNHLTKTISKGAMRSTVNSIKEFGEAISYEIEKLRQQGKQVPYQLKSAVALSTLGACEPGALTNMQNIFSTLSDSLYERKNAFIESFVKGYVEKYNIYDGSVPNIVHHVNELMHAVSYIYGLNLREDLYCAHSDPSILEKFVRDIEEYLSGREGAYRFVEFLAQYHASTLPNIPKDGITIKDNKGNDTEGFEKISMLCGTLNMSISDLCYNTVRYNPIKKMDEDMIHYKEDYVSIIEAAIIYQLILTNIIEHKEFLFQKKVEKTAGREIILQDKVVGGPLKGPDGKFVKQIIPGKEIVILDPIIESSSSWFLGEVISEATNTISIRDKVLDTKRLRDLTKDGQNFLDWLHDELVPPLNQGLKFHEALSAVISKGTSKESNINEESKDDIDTENINLDFTENEESKQDVDALSTEDIDIDMNDINHNLNVTEKAYKYNNEESKDGLELGDMQLEDQQDDNISKKLFLLSDQIELIKGYCSNEEIESMSIVDIKKWLDFIELLKTPETARKIDSVLKYIISDGSAFMLDAYINFADDGLRNDILDRMKNFSDDTKNTLPHLAVLKGKLDLASILIKNRVNINVQNIKGKTPLDHALELGRKDFVRLLVENGVNPYDELRRSIINGSKHADLLLEYVVDINKINEIDDAGLNLLHYALYNESEEVAKVLIEKGADINKEDKHGLPPLMYGIGRNNIPIVSMLLKGIQDVNAIDVEEKTILHFIIENSHVCSIEMFSIILDKCSDVDIKDEDGFPLLYKALVNVDERLIKLLMEKGAYINCSSEMRSIMLDKSSNIDIKDDEGKTQLDHAIDNGIEAFIKLLIKKGANLYAIDADGKTPFEQLLEKYKNDVDKLSDILKEAKNLEHVIVELIKLNTKEHDHGDIIESIMKKIPEERRGDLLTKTKTLLEDLPNSISKMRLLNIIISGNVLINDGKKFIPKKKTSFVKEESNVKGGGMMR